MGKSRKAQCAAECQTLEQIPNIGPAMAADLRQLGISTPSQLRSANALELYRQLQLITGQTHDPCVLDTFVAAIDFMSGAPARPWWYYTPLRQGQ